MREKTNDDSRIAFSMRNIGKSFGCVCANDSIDFEVREGEIHALLGENGSGKSTLMNILSGIYQPDCGEIEVYGRKKIFQSPKDSIACGIGMVHQHYKLAEALTAAENIAAGSRGILSRHKKEIEEIRSFSEKYGMEIQPEKLTNLCQ